MRRSTTTYFFNTQRAPKTRQSLSSVTTASIAPLLLRAASSASASPGACSEMKYKLSTVNGILTYLMIIKSKCLNHGLTGSNPFGDSLRINVFSMLEFGSIRPVENKY